ncbi:hypothetical protein [Nocardia brasiliensis]|uniref:hypothetical protein n=1 Tax=Nocardia brasiliensis TaxID=37326 RepID=UPI0024543632|nr:hypothetical protein [Nocardia brasiliensis]
MTSVVVWAGVDSRGPASLYIATDSRISWTPGASKWDQGRKAFACVIEPFIFGYWGDVLFPALALPLVQDQVDRGLVSASPGLRAHDVIAHAIRGLWSDYPNDHRRDLGIVIGSRAGNGMAARFLLTVMTYDHTRGDWALTSIPMPPSSASLHIAGSGSSEVRSAQRLWDLSSARNTSRAVFSAFCEALIGGGDSQSGGAPQVVGIHRIESASTIGVIYNKRRYVAGRSIALGESNAMAELPWFNDLFEIVDPKRKKRKLGAQHHSPR